MELYKILGAGIVSAVLILYLKNVNPEFAMLATIGAGIVISLLCLNYLFSALKIFSEITEKTGIDGNMIALLLKITGVAYLVEFTASSIEEFGGKSIASKVVFGGKIAILVMAIPIIKAILELIVGVVNQ